MLEQKQFNRYSILGQLAIWLGLILVFGMESMDYDDTLTAFVDAFVTIGVLMLAVYGHYYFLLPFLKKGKWLQYAILTLSFIVLFSGLNYLSYAWGPSDDELEYEFWGEFFYNFIYVSVFLGISSLYYFVENWMENIQTQSLLQNEKLQAELNFLKSQINPHFLFNTLNNIYSYAQTGNPKTAPMLERLSSILRYMVYDCGEQEVPLKKELSAVEDLLEIYKMKNSGQRNLQYNTQGVKGFHLIAPLILINIVENVFKHSDAINNREGFIDIKVEVDGQDNCKLMVRNSVKKKVSSSSPKGIGHSNIQNRLDLQYRDQYDWQVQLEDGIYQLDLSLPLSRKN